MTIANTRKADLDVELKKEIMLQINQTLFEKGMISKGVYEQAKIKLVNGERP